MLFVVAVPTPSRLSPLLAAISPPLKTVKFVSTGDLPTHTAAEAASALGLPDASTIVKSLACTAADGIPLLVLASGTSRLDMKKIEEWANCRVRLATASEAFACTGHHIGSIPPICHSSAATLKILMDQGVLELGETVYTGAGEPGLHIQIDPAELQRAAGAVVGDFAVDGTLPRRRPRCRRRRPCRQRPVRLRCRLPVLSPSWIRSRPPPTPSAAPTSARVAPARGRSRSDVEAVLAAKPLTDDPVELPRCEVVRVRRQARQPLFATLRLLEPARTAAAGRPVELPFDNAAEFQLIVGRSLVRRLGEEDAHALMRRVKVGCTLRASGRCQLNPRLTGPDLVAYELEILSAALDGHGRRDDAIVRAAADSVGAERGPATGARGGSGSGGGGGGGNGGKGKSSERGNADAEAAAPRTLAARRPLRDPTPPPKVTIVSDEASLAGFAAAMDEAIAQREPVAFDCEWRPRAYLAEEGDDRGTLELLQMATRREAFVIDVAAVTGQEGEPSSGALASLYGTVARLMRSGSSRKLGFAYGEDFRRLEASLPGVADGALAVEDLQPAAARATGAPSAASSACAPRRGAPGRGARQDAAELRLGRAAAPGRAARVRRPRRVRPTGAG